MSKEDEKYMALASHYATFSRMRTRHGSVIVLHGSVIAWGYNREHTCIHDRLGNPISCHAEMSALRDAIQKLKLKLYHVKDRTVFSKMRIYVARRSAEDTYAESKPCLHCYHQLKDLGVKRIMYSGINCFCIMDTRNPQSCVPSSGYKIIMRTLEA